MPPIVRPARPADAAIIAEYNLRLAQETESKTLDPAVLARGVAAVLADPTRGQYFVVEQNDEVLAQLLITSEWSDWRNGWIWWIQSVYVRADERRQGHFRALYRHVALMAGERGDVVGLRLYVERDNLRAQQTYQNLGMEATGYLVLERCPL